MTSTHECPKPGCMTQVPFEKLACPKHWYEIASLHRRQILKMWRDAPGSDAYFKARADCLRDLGVPQEDIAEQNAGVA